MHTEETLHKLLKSRWLIRLVNALLIIGIGWLVYPLVLPYLPVTDEQEPSPVKQAETLEAKQPEIYAQQIAAWHLLGESTETGATEQTRIPIDAPETKLQLSLKGIVATDDSKQGYAIIQKPGGEELHYKVGDSVFGLATLEEIYVSHIILMRNGHYETLRLPIEFMSGDPVLERARKKKIKQVVTDYRDTFLSRDGMELIKLFGFDTAYKNGSFIGFIVKALGDPGREMMETLGVEDGDLITVVNGMRLAESLDAIEKLKDLKGAASVDIVIDRGGVELPFHFDFEIPEGATVNEDGQITQGTPDTDSGSTGAISNGPSTSKKTKPVPRDYGETEEQKLFMEKQKARTTGSGGEVEFYD